jgi:hypothetical protein
MRKALLVLAVVLPLGGCLRAVDLPGTPDGSSSAVDTGLQPGPDASLPVGDASLPGPDAAYLSDVGVYPGPDAAIVGCKLDQECPAPIQTDPICNPLKAKCITQGPGGVGVCGSERIPRVWDANPGACNVAAECDCQTLSHDKCMGAYLCTLNKCDWKCGGCQSDMECKSGQVCQEVNCGQPKQCIDGCRDSAGCTDQKICGNFVSPFCGDSYGQCISGSTCQTEKDCPIGTACDFTGHGSDRGCIPGCHSKDNCPAGDECLLAMCPDCMNCPCVGQCQSAAGCKVDADCKNPDEVCGTDYANCTLHCRVGCHDDTKCHADEQCAIPKCAGCGCDTGTCYPRQVTCQLDTDCPDVGQICAFDDVMTCSGTKHCITGCYRTDQCPLDYECAQATCGGTGGCCPGYCVAMPPSCKSDLECELGEICTYDDHFGCSGHMTCQHGCRPDASGSGQGSCGAGELCQIGHCGSCCPGTCITTGCVNDTDCPTNYVCEAGPGCGGARTCVPGCHNANQCGLDQSCTVPKCKDCPCPGTCTGGSTCQSEKDCPIGTACDFNGHGTDKSCIPGCHSKDNCPAGDECILQACPACMNCPCVGTCEANCGTEKSCQNTMDCGAWGSNYCVNGCCSGFCPVFDPMPCADPNQCMYGGDVGSDGCLQGMKCATCVICMDMDLPVCGVNYQTYDCAAVAVAVGVDVLHVGACLPYEGMDCMNYLAKCATGQYCRDDCPMCGWDQMRCTEDGACVHDWDCPGPNPPPTCAGAKWFCDATSHGCNFTCP